MYLCAGGSLAKLVYFEPNTPSDSKRNFDEEEMEQIAGGTLHFIKFEVATKLDELVNFIRDNNLHHRGTLKVTGGGAHKYAALFEEKLDVKFEKEDEMKSLIEGLNFLLKNIPNESFTYSSDMNDPSPKKFDSVQMNPFPYLLVNIGSGVSLLKVDGEKTFTRVGGTSLGGGTFWGLCHLLTGVSNFDEMLELSKKGDSRKVDLLVGDIYGTDYSRIGLSADVIASSFGKIMYKQKEGAKIEVRREDIALSLLSMITNNIGQIAYLTAMRYGLKQVFFGGFFIRGNPFTMAKMSFAINFWSKGTMKAHFLTHEGYLGAMGALISENADLYQKSLVWFGKKKEAFSDFISNWVDMNIRHPKKLKIECQCGTPFCEGIVCKLSTENSNKKNSKNPSINHRGDKSTFPKTNNNNSKNNNNSGYLITVDVKNGT